MVTVGTPSPIKISQKRLTIVLAVLGLLGCLVLGLVWWDTTRYCTTLTTKNYTWNLIFSAIYFNNNDFDPFAVAARSAFDFSRMSVNVFMLDVSQTIFPAPKIREGSIIIPIYLLILAYLASLLLIWVVLMNRLARRHFTKTRGITAKE